MQDTTLDKSDRQSALRIYLILSGVFIASLVSCNLIFLKFFTWIPFGLYEFQISVGLLAYPVTFLITDIISEIYGRKMANQVVVTGLVASVFVLGVVWIAGLTDATSWSTVDNKTFVQVFGATGPALAASMMAYLIAQFIDIRIYHFWKRLTKGKHLWLRNNFSTIFSQLVDTLVVLLILCNYGTLKWENFAQLLENGFVFKVMVAAVDTLPFYVIVWAFRRRFKLKVGEEVQI